MHILRILKNIFSHRALYLILALLLQLSLLIGLFIRFSAYSAYFYGFSAVLSLLVVILIVNTEMNPAYKLAWIIPILLFPIFGGLFYLLFGHYRPSRSVHHRMEEQNRAFSRLMHDDAALRDRMESRSPSAACQSRYIQRASSYPAAPDTGTEYLPSGEIFHQRLLKELAGAEKFIYLEFFIVQEGEMWNSILDILKTKARDGVDVRLIYDDAGCLSTLPHRYDRTLRQFGIRTLVFNRLVPLLSTFHNNRDHRKIVCIDGRLAFTGGVNLADEYINRHPKYGHWKDSAILVTGGAAWSLTLMFISLWSFLEKPGTAPPPTVAGTGGRASLAAEEWFSSVAVETAAEEGHAPGIEMLSALGKGAKMTGKGAGKAFPLPPPVSPGAVQPFPDSPLDDEPVGESVYLNIISKAEKYVYITTPYLVIGSEMVTALSNAAKSGVDVRILTPGIPDKPYVYAVTRSFYASLLRSGVRIYEYTPGFIHSKVFVSDDRFGVVGTINCDFRSLYLHFECGVWLFDVPAIADIRRDVEETLTLCREVTTADGEKNRLKIIGTSILRLFAPLM